MPSGADHMNLKHFIIPILILITVMIVTLMADRWIMELNSTRLLELQQEQKQLKIDSILRCQEIFANTVREDFSYKSCVSEIDRVVTQTKLL